VDACKPKKEEGSIPGGRAIEKTRKTTQENISFDTWKPADNVVQKGTAHALEGTENVILRNRNERNVLKGYGNLVSTLSTSPHYGHSMFYPICY
jgi:hypothetical protein